MVLVLRGLKLVQCPLLDTQWDAASLRWVVGELNCLKLSSSSSLHHQLLPPCHQHRCTGQCEGEASVLLLKKPLLIWHRASLIPIFEKVCSRCNLHHLFCSCGELHVWQVKCGEVKYHYKKKCFWLAFTGQCQWHWHDDIDWHKMNDTNINYF